MERCLLMRVVAVVFGVFLTVLHIPHGAAAADLNLWSARGNPTAVTREVTHNNTTHKVTVWFRTVEHQDQTLPILCPSYLWSACLLDASPTTTPSLLANCTYVPYSNVTVIGDPTVARVEHWHCATGESVCQNAEGWIRETGTGALEIVATGGGGPTTGCSPK